MNVIINDDWWGAPKTPVLNAVLSTVFSAEGVELVTLTEVKAHLHITYADEDTYLTALLKQARASIEKYTGLSLISRTVTAKINNSAGGIQLPYGPVVAITSMADANGLTVEAANYSYLNSYLHFPVYNAMTVVYTAGYTVMPPDLKLAILFEIEYFIRLREGEKTDLKEVARELAAPFKTSTWIL